MVGAYKIDSCAKRTTQVFRIRTYKGNNICFYNSKKNRFDKFDDKIQLLSCATKGVFTLKYSENYSILSYEATQFVRFPMFVGVIKGNNCYLLRAITTPEGIRIYDTNYTMHRENDRWSIPRSMEMFQFNTVIILGVFSRLNNIRFDVQGHGSVQWNYTGWKIDGPLDGNNLVVIHMKVQIHHNFYNHNF